MAEQGNKSLEDRLKGSFDCAGLCSLYQIKAEFRLNKANAMRDYLDEHYLEAQFSFMTALTKTDSVSEKDAISGKLLDCAKQLFRISPTEEEFNRLRSTYEFTIRTHETADNFLSYMNFLGKDMAEVHHINMMAEAIRVGEIALERFPEDHRIHSEMYELYVFTENYKEAQKRLEALVKLKFDDPDYLINEFGKMLWQPGEVFEMKKAPFYIIMEYKGHAILRNPEALQKYGRYMLRNINTHEEWALYTLYKAWKGKPTLDGIKKDVVEAFDKAAASLRRRKNGEQFKALHKNYAEVAKLKKELRNENPNATRVDEVKEFSKEVKVVLPREIKAHLDDYVIGQEKAKMGVSVGYYMHLLRLRQAMDKNAKKLDKSNMLLLGPTGSGKTYMLNMLAKMSGVPFVVIDTSKVTSAGYVGDKAEQCLLALLGAANGNVELAQRGIVYLDEADKIRAIKGGGKDVNGEGAQQQYLKLLEGSVVNVEVSQGKYIQIDTTNILFVVGGAFSFSNEGGSIGEVIGAREKHIGFRMGGHEEAPKNKGISGRLTDKDLIEYGFIPEFVGRLHHRIVLEQLSERELRKILTEPADAVIPQYVEMFRLSDVKLDVRPDALDTIAEEAYALNAGARSLRTICDSLFEDALFYLPGSSIKNYSVGRGEVLKAVGKN
ncbi:MAG TPA: AAA domain-containing protein [Nanoarchaeota archaeon]|nr:AAA domain-containing protein [Nanoarchaeota archaeon]